MSFVFPIDAQVFFADLRDNNTKEWFAENKPRYAKSVQAPAKEFVEIFGPKLEELAGCSLESKIFRIHRDLRFSKDKTPYKAYQHFLFAPQGRGKSGPAFFFALEPDKLFIGVGMFEFNRDELDRFRSKVVSKEGATLSKLLDVQRNAGRRIRDPEMKKVPRGFDADHERADLLRHKGLSVWIDIEDAALATRPEFTTTLLKDFESLLPVLRWLMDEVLEV